jgi:hypothetical protein
MVARNVLRLSRELIFLAGIDVHGHRINNAPRYREPLDPQRLQINLSIRDPPPQTQPSSMLNIMHQATYRTQRNQQSSHNDQQENP